MLKDKKILFIGFGKMGQAIADGLVLNSFHASDIKVIDPFWDAKTYKHSVVQLKDVSDISNHKIDICIIAIKPQEFETLKQYHLNDDVVFLSIAAGRKIEYIKNYLGYGKKIVRAMPNLPATVGQGITGIFKSPNINEGDFEMAKNIFKYCGEIIEVHDEDALDIITALSGSTPGFIYNLMQIMQKIAENYGFSSSEARKIVQSTFYGSLFLAASSNKNYEELKNAVTSKGGTTEAGINVLNTNNALEKLFSDAIEAAYRRSIELSA